MVDRDWKYLCKEGHLSYYLFERNWIPFILNYYTIATALNLVERKNIKIYKYPKKQMASVVDAASANSFTNLRE